MGSFDPLLPKRLKVAIRLLQVDDSGVNVRLKVGTIQNVDCGKAGLLSKGAVGEIRNSGGPGRTRTYNQQIMSLLL